MKAQLLMLSAAGLLSAASALPTQAAPSELQQFATQVEARTDRLLIAAGVRADDPPLTVRAGVANDGHLTGVSLVRSSGSAETDAKVRAIFERVLWSAPPVGLANGAITLSVGGGHGAQATAR